MSQTKDFAMLCIMSNNQYVSRPRSPLHQNFQKTPCIILYSYLGMLRGIPRTQLPKILVALHSSIPRGIQFIHPQFLEIPTFTAVLNLNRIEIKKQRLNQQVQFQKLFLLYKGSFVTIIHESPVEEWIQCQPSCLKVRASNPTHGNFGKSCFRTKVRTHTPASETITLALYRVSHFEVQHSKWL